MNYNILTVTGGTMTDEQWRASDRATKLWWCRVYQLINDTRCDLDTAIRAVRDADAQQQRGTAA